MEKTNSVEPVLNAEVVTTIISNIDAMYATAISQLTTYTFGVVALVGVLLPIILGVVQSRSNKADKEELGKHIEKEISAAEKKISTAIQAEIAEKIALEVSNMIEPLKQKIEDYELKFSQSRAGLFHLQGTMSKRNKLYAFAAMDYATSTIEYLKGGDESNGQRVLRLLQEECLPKVNKKDGS